MNNNDVVRRIRFIYNIKNADMIKIFEDYQGAIPRYYDEARTRYTS